MIGCWRRKTGRAAAEGAALALQGWEEALATARAEVEDLRKERDWYRAEWQRAISGTSMQAGKAAEMQAAPNAAWDEGWSADDRELYREWCDVHGWRDEEVARRRWMEQYGETPPLLALTI